MALSIIFLNVNGLRKSSNREGVLQWLRSLPVTVDVVSLQETHCTSDVQCHSWFSSSGLSSVPSPGTSHSDGCVILYCPALTLVNSWCEVAGRSLCSDVVGPKEAIASGINNVVGPKEAVKSNDNDVVGPKEAVASSKVTGPKVAHNSNVVGQKVAGNPKGAKQPVLPI